MPMRPAFRPYILHCNCDILAGKDSEAFDLHVRYLINPAPCTSGPAYCVIFFSYLFVSPLTPILE